MKEIYVLKKGEKLINAFDTEISAINAQFLFPGSEIVTVPYTMGEISRTYFEAKVDGNVLRLILSRHAVQVTCIYITGTVQTLEYETKCQLPTTKVAGL